jgi:hypothetical protein
MAGTGKQVYFDASPLPERIVKAVADYLNGKSVPVSGGVGAAWSDWRDSIDGSGRRVRVPGSKRHITAIDGVISATANGTKLKIDIIYSVKIETAPDDWRSDVTEVPDGEGDGGEQ